MRVLDASVVTNAMAVSGDAGDAARHVLGRERRLHVPEILTAEVTSGLRGMVHRGHLEAGDARAAAGRAASLPLRRYPFKPFLDRTWALRENVTTYDAWYIALAESLDASLITADDRLRHASGPRCPVLTPEEVLAR